jgi:adenylosuccinate lyase
MNRVSQRLQVDRNNMQRNFELNKDKIIAEPLYNLLAFYGHLDAHEHIRKLTMQSYRTGKPLTEIVQTDKELKPYLKKFTRTQMEVISNPAKYIGIAAEKTEKTATFWEKKLKEANLWK